MTYYDRRTTKGSEVETPRLTCPADVWREGVAELRRRTEGWHESGAFLLGERDGELRRILKFAYYDDLDPHSLDSGIVIFDGAGYGPLWGMCSSEELTVVADIHVHPGLAWQSESDRTNPMIARRGHIALIAPDFAEGDCMPGDLGVYEYEGGYRWTYRGGAEAVEYFRIEE
jgi:proteasome lid subunit RPN8/RPN11